jgi:hypothetical protein
MNHGVMGAFVPKCWKLPSQSAGSFRPTVLGATALAPAAMPSRGRANPRRGVSVRTRWGWGPSASENKSWNLALQGAVVFAVLVSATSTAHAQTLEVGGGVRRYGAMSLGASEANETAPGGSAFRLFTTESQLNGPTAFEARIALRLSDRWALEANGSYGTPVLSTRIGSDVEGIPDVTATESVQQFTIEGAVVRELQRWQLGRRTVPFVSAGAGYMRHLHERQTLAESGALYYLGAGANIILIARPDARLTVIGVRLDARAVFRAGGAAFDDDAHVAPTAGATLFVRF